MKLSSEKSTAAVALVGALLSMVLVVSPIDLLPDWIPIIGWIDDLLMMAIGGATFVYAIRILMAPDNQITDRSHGKPAVIDADTGEVVGDNEAYDPVPPEELKAW